MKTIKFISGIILITMMIVPSLAVGVGESKKTYTEYEAAFIVSENIKSNKYESELYIDRSKEEVRDYLTKIANQLDNISGYMFKISGTYIKESNQIKLKIKIDRNAEESDKAEIISKSAEKIAAQAKSNYSDIKKQLAYVNDTLVGLCEYDSEAAKNVEIASDLAWSAYGCLIEGKAVCAGYTNAFTIICEKLGIPVIEVIGNSPTGQLHTWNKVLVDNTWMHIDVTSNDPVWKGTPSISEKQKVSRRYFLVTDSAMSKAGFIWDLDREEITKDIKYPDNMKYEASQLDKIGIIKGTNTGYDLNRELTRAEMAIILARINGASKQIEQNTEYWKSQCKFTDVPDWAKPYVGYCVKYNLIEGININTYGSNNPISKRDFSVLMMRTLGIQDSEYNYFDATNKAINSGIVAKGRNDGIRSDKIYRSDAVDTLYRILDLKLNGGTSIKENINNANQT